MNYKNQIFFLFVKGFQNPFIQGKSMKPARRNWFLSMKGNKKKKCRKENKKNSVCREVIWIDIMYNCLNIVVDMEARCRKREERERRNNYNMTYVDR